MWDKGDFEYKTRYGGKEKISILESALAGRYETYGVLCQSKDRQALRRERISYDDQNLLVLRAVDEPDGIVGYVTGETTAEAIRAGRGLSNVRPVQYALNDLTVQMGQELVDRALSVRSDFRRDPAVRDHVLRLANGKCEYCGKDGFLTPDGRRYLEVHHIIALADLGKDMIDNVIALCAEHHREAHFGIEAEYLENEFLSRIRQRVH